jgi:hypothetical protein
VREDDKFLLNMAFALNQKKWVKIIDLKKYYIIFD